MNQEYNIYTNDYKYSNKKRRILIFSILIILLILIGMIIWLKSYMNTAKTFKYNWGITLPKHFKEEYHIETEQAFGGDGERYSIYSGTEFSFNYNDDSNIELEQQIEELNTTLNIPEEKQINFEHTYQWEKVNNRDDKRDTLYIIYDKELNKYYFYEIFL